MSEQTYEKLNKIPLISKIKSSKKAQLIIVVLLLIVALYILFASSSKEPTVNNSDELSLYVKDLESRLEDVLSQVSGAGQVKVVINVESGKETVLAMETKIEESAGKKVTEEKPLVVNGKTIVLKELTPKITGVIIVAEGAQNISVLTKISQATQSLLNIKSNQIEILSMK